eukprot:186966-Chlamydomonas_euryale.AAC.4
MNGWMDGWISTWMIGWNLEPVSYHAHLVFPAACPWQDVQQHLTFFGLRQRSGAEVAWLTAWQLCTSAPHLSGGMPSAAKCLH